MSRVSAITGVERPDAAYQAQVIVDLVQTVVPPSDFRQLRDALPENEDDENWRKLFEVVDAGGWAEREEGQTGGGPQPDAWRLPVNAD